MNVEKKLYGRPLSTIFGLEEKSYFVDDDPDPIVNELRMLDYRYVRLFFHQQKDRFLLFNGWKDPNWTDLRAVKSGLDSDEKSVREVVFGRNDIEIEQKSVTRLLLDEVGSPEFCRLACHSLNRARCSTRSTFFRSLASFSGHWTSTTTTPSPFS